MVYVSMFILSSMTTLMKELASKTKSDLQFRRHASIYLLIKFPYSKQMFDISE